MQEKLKNFNKDKNNFKKLLSKIKNKRTSIGVVGLGYVGLQLAKTFLYSGNKVIGFESDNKKINLLKKRKSYINYIKDKEIKKMFYKKFIIQNSYTKINSIDIIVLCLPTPVNNKNIPDISIIKKAMKRMQPYLKPFQVIILESTTFPGTTDEVLLPDIKKKFSIGKNFFLVYSPEREDPANTKYSMSKTPKIVSGVTKNCLKAGNEIYKSAKIKTILVSSTKVAETSKLLENTYRSVNIALVNQLKKFCEKLNINVFDVIDAAKTKPFGFQAFYPGPGYGGHCIPVDPHYLFWKAKKLGVDLNFISLASKINNNMPTLVVEKIINFFKKNKKKLKSIIVIGAAYKKNVNDTRNSPALKIIELLHKMKIKVSYYDPYVRSIKINRKIFKSKILTKKLILNAEATLLVTDHEKIDYKLLVENSKILFDSRGKFRNKVFSNVRFV